jgi:DNA-binding GntR family transcriptional regulator
MSASSPNSSAAEIGATTAMRVAADLRRRILLGELAPGQRLKIDELASLCDVSHMPVREALHELESEGVLDVFPHRGAVVRGVDAEFVRNTYDVREAIEGMLTERCAERIDKAGLARLEAAVDAYESLARKRNPATLLDANRAIHDTINEVASNPQAVRVLAQGRLLIEALRLRFGYGTGRVDDVVAQHRALFRAIARHDVERAGRLARQHCVAARDDLLALLQR